MALPTRHLCGDKPHRYVRAVDTDVRRTFRRARLLMRLSERNRNNDATVVPGAV
jgi:hypothetical protein